MQAITGEYERIANLLRNKFAGELSRKDPKVVDTLLILVLSLHLGWDTVSEAAKRLSVPKGRLYEALKELGVNEWLRLFDAAFEELAIQALTRVQSQSDATWSRAGVVLAIDDSVIRRWGKLLSYLGTWWSGQFHHVLKGQDIVMAVLRVGDEVIPAHFKLMSTKGKMNNRHKRVARMVEQLALKWKGAGIDIARIPVSMDAGYADSDLIEAIRGAGFTKVITGAKANYIIYPDRSKKHKDRLDKYLDREHINSEGEWGISEPVGFLKGTSPTFGNVKVCARFVLGKVRRVFAFGIHRVAEIVNVWKSHHWVEQFFKRMKHLLSWGSYRLRDMSGAHASIVIPFLSYYLLLRLQQRMGSTFDKIIDAIKQMAYNDINALIAFWKVETLKLKLAMPDELLS